MKKYLNSISISEWILKEDKKMLPTMSPEDLWYHIQSYTNDEVIIDYVYERLKWEVKR